VPTLILLCARPFSGNTTLAGRLAARGRRPAGRGVGKDAGDREGAHVGAAPGARSRRGEWHALLSLAAGRIPRA